MALRTAVALALYYTDGADVAAEDHLKKARQSQALYDEAKKNGWSVISMKNDWKRIFAFE
jgi:hypothetical protein